MHIVFVCTGNTCRSPMAEHLFRAKLRKQGRKGITCGSAGLYAEKGQPATGHSTEVCKEQGVNLEGHRATPLDAREVGKIDLFVAMTDEHATVLRGMGIPEKKILRLGAGIPDPYGGDMEAYRVCRNAISAGLNELLDKLENFQ